MALSPVITQKVDKYNESRFYRIYWLIFTKKQLYSITCLR